MGMRRHSMRGHSRIRGAAVVEFAFVAFAFFLILLGIMDFARTFYVRNSTQYLTRCIAREAVIRQPHAISAAEAKQACLMPATGGFHYWPFFHTTPAEMSGMFVVRYFRSDGAWVLASDITDSSYANQASLCAFGSANCVQYVQTYVPEGQILDMFNLIKTWIGSGGGINEPFAATTMPAESMGYIP